MHLAYIRERGIMINIKLLFLILKMKNGLEKFDLFSKVTREDLYNRHMMNK